MEDKLLKWEDLVDKKYHFVIETIIKEINIFLHPKIGDQFKLKVVVRVDYELPSWRTIVFLIKTENIEYNEILRFWDEIGNFIKDIKTIQIDNHKEDEEQIKKIYQSISIEFEDIDYRKDIKGKVCPRCGSTKFFTLILDEIQKSYCVKCDKEDLTFICLINNIYERLRVQIRNDHYFLLGFLLLVFLFVNMVLFVLIRG